MNKKDEPINFKKAMEIFSNDFKLYVELFDKFLIEFPEYIVSLKNAINEKDNKVFKFHAHKIKGVFISLGADYGAEIAGMLEKIDIERESTVILHSLLEEFERIKKSFLIYKNK